MYISLPGVDDMVMKKLMTYIYTGNLANTSNTMLSEMKECARSLELEVKMKEEAVDDWRSTPGKAGKGRKSKSASPETTPKSRGRAGPASSKKKKPDNDIIKIDIEEITSVEPEKEKKSKKTKKVQEEEEEYEVELIVDKREMMGRTEYLVKWRGWEEIR